MSALLAEGVGGGIERHQLVVEIDRVNEVPQVENLPFLGRSPAARNTLCPAIMSASIEQSGHANARTVRTTRRPDACRSAAPVLSRPRRVVEGDPGACRPGRGYGATGGRSNNKNNNFLVSKAM